jgi:hypothetical protein
MPKGRRVRQSQVYLFREGEEVETTQEFAQIIAEKIVEARINRKIIPREPNYYCGQIRTIFNQSDINGSVVTILDSKTSKAVVLNELHLQRYDGREKEYRGGQLISDTIVDEQGRVISPSKLESDAN